MGGKRKQQAQRTKNCAKPSSSGRSAELLGNEAGGFVGFTCLKDNFAVQNLSGIHAVAGDILDPNIDPHFLVVLKKMGKKDATTKHKALLEFVGLCQTSEPDIVNAVLPAWVRIYSVLVMDAENRVREAAQLAHKAIVTIVGRNLAPYLKQVAPFWLISQYDTYPPAATAATIAFQEVFPPKKMTDVIVFCQEEILRYITENLLNQPPQMLGKTEKAIEEEMYMKYQRVVASSLYGYALYLKLLPAEKLEELKEANQKLISTNKFWNFAKHKSPCIRAAWYSTLISICQNGVFLLENVYKNAVNSVFNNLDEADPCVLPVVWEATLHVLVAVKEWWQHLNTTHFVFPKLFNILSRGGQGNASIIYPHLLPLLSSIPNALVEDKTSFYDKFFTSLLAGFKQQSITQSMSESEAGASTFTECIRYLMVVNNSEEEFCKDLLEKHLLNLMKSSMVDPLHRLLISPLYQSVAQLVYFWERNLVEQQLYRAIVQKFWDSLSEMCTNNFDSSLNDSTTLAHVLSCHAQLFDALKHLKITKKKNLRVKFATPSDSSNDPPQGSVEAKSSEEGHERSATVSGGSVEVNKKVHALEQLLINKYLTIVREYESKEVKILVIQHMWKVVKIDVSGNVIRCLISSEQKFCDALSSWMKDESIPVKPLLGLIFSTLNHLQDQDVKNRLLMDLTEMRLKEAIVEAIKITQSGQECSIQTWLRSETIKNTLCNFALDLASENLEDSDPVIRHCFTILDNGDFAVSNATVCAILEILASLIGTEDRCNYQRFASLMDSLFNAEGGTFFVSEHCEIVFEILWLIFMKLTTQEGTDLFKVWKKGVSLMVKIHKWDSDVFISYCDKCAASITNWFEDSSGVSVSTLNQLCSIIFCFIQSAVSGENDKEKKSGAALTLSQKFLNSVFNTAQGNWENSIHEICLHAEQIFGTIADNQNKTENFPLSSAGKWDPLHGINVLNYSHSAAFCVKFLTYLLDGISDLDTSDDSFAETFFAQPELESNSELLLKLVFSHTLFKTLSKYFSSTSQIFESMPFISTIEQDLKEMVQMLSERVQNDLILITEKKCEGANSMWELTNILLHQVFLDKEKEVEQNSEEKLENLRNSETLNEENIRFLRFQVLGKKPVQKEVSRLLKMITVDQISTSSIAFDRCIANLDPSNLNLISEICRFLDVVLKHQKELVKQKDCDFIMVALASWVQSICKTQSYKFYKEFVGFFVAVCDLYITFSEILIHETESEMYRNFSKEWEDVFAFDSYHNFSTVWKILAEKCTNGNMVPISLLHIEKLCSVMNYIIKVSTFLPTPSNTSSVLSWIKQCCSFITSSCPAVQITSYQIFLHIAPLLLEIDSGIDESCCSKLSCSLIKESFLNTEAIVKTILQDFRIGIICAVKPYTDSYTYTRAYLMLWLTLLRMCKLGDSQLRYLYTLWIKENEILSCLIENLLRLMPEPVIHLLEVNVKKTQELFASPPPLTFDGWTSDRLSHLCCWVYCSLLRILPALARQWVVDADSKVGALIDKLTSAFVSPILCNEEMEYIKNQEKGFDNMKIRTHPLAREVVAVYTLEDCATELVVTLTPNHPLSPPKVEISKAMGSSSKTRNLLMQLTIFLTHQNGNIWDGLILWKSNLDKKFEGVEECYICFSILHNSNHQLPKLSCQTCRKKFHSICLYKWFTMSNKSTCPICRNLF